MSSPNSGLSPSSPVTTSNTVILELQTACTKLFRVVLNNFRKDRIDSNIISRIHRSNGSLVLWARDYGLAYGSANKNLILMPRLRKRIMKSLKGTCEVLLHRLLPLIKCSDHTNVQEAKESANRVLSVLESVENDDDGDASSIISTYSVSSDLLEEACSDLDNEIECLMALSPMLETDARSEGKRSFQLAKGEQVKSSTERSETACTLSLETSSASDSKTQERNKPLKRAMEPNETLLEAQASRKAEQTDIEAISLDTTSAISTLTIADDTYVDVSKHPLSNWAYYFPREEHDKELADMTHDMTMRLRKHKLALAPLSGSTQRILDLGAGTGIWAIDIADEYPSAAVLGWDLSGSQFPEFVPPNLEWEIQDFETKWHDEDEPKDLFDLIHTSETILAVKNHSVLFRRALENLKPGGWFELKFFDYTVQSDHTKIDPDSPLVRVWHELERALKVQGVDTAMTNKGRVGTLLKNHGFDTIQETEYKVPLGTWAKDEAWKTIGLEARMIFYENLRSLLTAPLLHAPSWPDETAVNEFIESVQSEVKSTGLIKSKLHIWYRVVCGQKPTPNSRSPSP